MLKIIINKKVCRILVVQCSNRNQILIDKVGIYIIPKGRIVWKAACWI